MTVAIELDDAIDGEFVEDGPDERSDEDRKIDEYVAGLRDVADFLEVHRGVVPAFGIEVTKWCPTAEKLAVAVRAIGSGQKIESDYRSGVKVKIGPHTVQVCTSKENTCKKVPTGDVKTETKVAESPADVPADARNVRTVTVTQTVYDEDEPVMEWDCGSLLAAGTTPEVTP